jgi:glutamate synthase domain-containing protein 3
VGDRFAVRNSGVVAVVEGTGDHACEYMTAGAVVILGPTGRNLGAGMTGGALFVLDAEGQVARRHHPDWVALDTRISEEEEEWLHRILEAHEAATGSVRASARLQDWARTRRLFVRVLPAAAGERAALPAFGPAAARQFVAEGREPRAAHA